MQVELNGHDTRLLLSSEPWSKGIRKLVVAGNIENPFLVPALTGPSLLYWRLFFRSSV